MKPGAFSASLLAAALHAPQAWADARFDAIDTLLAREVANGRAPSAQYYRFDRRRILHGFRIGHADLGTGLAMGPGTAFHAYSVTKTFTAVAVLRLAEQGRLSLADPVIRHLPDAPVPRGMTLLHLLSHTSGLANPMPMKWIHGREEHAGFDRNGFFRPILAGCGGAGDAPGSRFRYSNLGYVLLGQVIEAASGMPYERFIGASVIAKSGIAPGELGFDRPQGGGQAVGYHPRYSLSMLALGFLIDKPRYLGPPSGSWTPFREHYVNGAPYGGLIGTAGAFVKFGQALLDESGPLLSDSSRSLMFREVRTASGKPTGMALGWFTGGLEGRRYVAHAGGGGGFYCELRLYPEAGEGSFLVFNRSGFSDARFLDRLDGLALPPRSAGRRSPPPSAFHRSGSRGGRLP